MESETNASWIKSAGRRTMIVVALIAVLTPFWIYLAFFTNLPTVALAGVGLLTLLVLSIATAWAATAMPSRKSDQAGRRTE